MKQTIDLIESFLITSERVTSIGDKALCKKYAITHKNVIILKNILKKWKCTISDIKKIMITSDASISKTIRQLEEKWLLNKERVWKSTELTLTKKGEDLTKKVIASTCEKYIEWIDKALSKTEKDAIAKFITILNDQIDTLEVKYNKNEEVI